MTDSAPLRCAACTIVSPNYLPYARVLASSYLAAHPGHQFFVLIVSSTTDEAPFAAEPFQAVLLTSLGLPHLRGEAMKYDILELNTNVKPSFIKFLLARHTLDRVVYLDPDIFVYAPLAPVFKALETSNAVLTPHITSPLQPDGKSPTEVDLLFNGTYNLGFIALSNTPEAGRLLDWWERRCLDNGFSEGRTGLFVDQKWVNLVPGLFAGVHILRHPGCNMAYWNLHERTLVEAVADLQVVGPSAPPPGQPDLLCFFHFSGVVPGSTELISKNTSRFTLADRPDLTSLFADYGQAVLAVKNSASEKIPYGFDTFSDGTAVTRLCRRLYAANQSAFPQPDPFDAHGPWLAFARREKLVAGKALPAKETWHDFQAQDRRVALVNKLLRLSLRVLGPNRYELLMRYLGHISVLRNQAVFLKPKP